MQNINMNLNNETNTKLDLLERHADHLARMKSKNRSTADMLAWLRTHGVNQVHGGHLAAFWKRREAAQANPQNNNVPLAAELESQTDTCDTSRGTRNLDPLMDKYLILLDKMLDKARQDPSQENLKQVNLMMRTAINYERSQNYLRHRELTLKLKEASQKLKNQNLVARAPACPPVRQNPRGGENPERGVPASTSAKFLTTAQASATDNQNEVTPREAITSEFPAGHVDNTELIPSLVCEEQKTAESRTADETFAKA